MTARVAVIGGGITGLAAAYELRRAGPPDLEITVFESDSRLGGKLRSSPFAGLPAVDEGADAFLARVPWAADLCHEIGLDDLVSPATGKAYIWWDGHLHALPEGLVLGVPAGLWRLARSGLLSLGGRGRAALEPLIGRDHPAADNLGALIRHRFGDEVLERLVDPLVGSINAGDADRLSLEATAPQVAEVAARSRSLLLGLRRRAPAPSGPVFLAPRAGMQSLVDALASRLPHVQVLLDERVVALGPTGGAWEVNGRMVDRVVITTPADVSAATLRAVVPDAAALLAGIGHASVVMVTLAFPETAAPALDGSGHLVPKPVQRHITAASWASTKWAHWKLPGQVILRVSLGRWGDEHAVDEDDEAIVGAALADLDTQLGIHDAPTEVRVTRWPRSFPQYAPGHLARIAAIERSLAMEAHGLMVAGASCRGLGVPACIRQGRDAATAILRSLAR